MKSLFLAMVVLLSSFSFLMAQNADSLLIEQHKAATDNYTFFSTALPDSTPATMHILINKADSVMAFDAKLIEQIAVGKKNSDTLASQVAKLNEELAKSKETTDLIEKYKWFAVGGAGFVVLLMFIFMFSYFGKASSSKKKIKKLNKTLGETEELKTKASELEAENATLKSENTTAIEKLKSGFETEKKTLQSKVDELGASVNLNDAQIKSLETSLAAKTEAASKTNDLQLQISQLESKLNVLAAERDAALQNQSGVADKYMVQLNEKDELIANLQREMQEVKKEKNELILASHNIPAPDNSKIEELERELKYKREDIEQLENKLHEIDNSKHADNENLKNDYDRLLDDLKMEREARIEAEQKPAEIRIEPSGNADVDQLRKELADEKAVRMEMEMVLEQILKNKQA
jgi:myosin heavy subunit